MTEQRNDAPDARERAEQLVDRVTGDVAALATRLLARAREEAEDIWAEARMASHAEGSRPPRR
jgi:ribose 1,5-bisphosphokinase PhnN